MIVQADDVPGICLLGLAAVRGEKGQRIGDADEIAGWSKTLLIECAGASISGEGWMWGCISRTKGKAMAKRTTKAPVVANFPIVGIGASAGGLEAMTMMAFALGLDPLFVGAHHIGRFLLISLSLPFAARWAGVARGEARS